MNEWIRLSQLVVIRGQVKGAKAQFEPIQILLLSFSLAHLILQPERASDNRNQDQRAGPRYVGPTLKADRAEAESGRALWSLVRVCVCARSTHLAGQQIVCPYSSKRLIRLMASNVQCQRLALPSSGFVFIFWRRKTTKLFAVYSSKLCCAINLMIVASLPVVYFLVEYIYVVHSSPKFFSFLLFHETRTGGRGRRNQDLGHALRIESGTSDGQMRSLSLSLPIQVRIMLEARQIRSFECYYSLDI